MHDLRVWSEEFNWAQQAEVDAAVVVSMLLASPLFVAHPVTSADAQSLAAIVCKASAQASRGAVEDLRGLRYDLEAQLSSALEDTTRDLGLDSSLASCELALRWARREMQDEPPPRP